MGIFRKKIGLALGSGGGKGITHVGVLKELEANNIRIDYISGCSIGALIGALYATTKSSKLIEDLCFSADTKKVLVSFSDISLKEGLINGDKLFDLFGDFIPKDMLIQDTQIPLNIVTSDLETGERFVIKEGNLRKAIRSSISIPLLFEPVRWQGKVLVDGGITEPVPIQTLLDMGAEKTIGVNLYAGVFPRELSDKKLGTGELTTRSVDVALQELARRDLKQADVVINMPVKEVPLTAFADDPTEYIRMGVSATREQISKIKTL